MGESNTKSIVKNDILFLQGESYGSFYYLHSGTLEILSADAEYNGLDKSLILPNSRRIGIIQEKSFVAGFANKTIRAMSECAIQEYPIPSQGFQVFAVKDPATSGLFLQHLMKRVDNSLADLNRAIKLYQNLYRVSDNLAVLFKELSAIELPNTLKERADSLYKEFAANTSNIPANIDAKFIITDRAKIFKKTYDMPEYSPENLLNTDFTELSKKIISINKTIFPHIIKADPSIALIMYNKITDSIKKLFGCIEDVGKKLDSEMTIAFGAANSWTSVLFDANALRDWYSSGRLSPEFIKDFIGIIEKLYNAYGEVTGFNSNEILPGLDKAKQFVSSNAEQSMVSPKADSTPTAAGEALPSIEIDQNVIRLYANSIQQIFQFSAAGADLQKELLQSLNEFKKMRNPFDTDSDARKIRRAVTKAYWDLFTLVYMRLKSSPPAVPAPVKLFLMYGYLDENMVDQEQIIILHKMASDKYKPNRIPILYEHEFLSYIFAKKEEPSVNEMGLNYLKNLQERCKTARKGENPMDELDDPVKKTIYEIHNRLATTASICSGSRSTAFPIFNNQLVKGNITNFIYTKSEIEKAVEEIISIDYSLFYRETVAKLSIAREVVEEEVLPYIVILPIIGSNTMMWQELAGTSKKTRARIVVPAVFMGDIKKSLSHSFALFRWELNRTIKGGMWADPIEGGLTGAYSDYVQFFKKNSKLSTEAKARLSDRLKGLRNNVREMFAEDYYLWLFYEKQKIMKLNPVVRDMFYRYLPFKKDIRDELEKMPAFQDSAMRFKNIRTRVILGQTSKFRKYLDPVNGYPPEIQHYLDFLQM